MSESRQEIEVTPKRALTNQSEHGDLEGLPLGSRILCALGYHRWEKRYFHSDAQMPRDRWFGHRPKEPPEGSRSRGQCGRCGKYA